MIKYIYIQFSKFVNVLYDIFNLFYSNLYVWLSIFDFLNRNSNICTRHFKHVYIKNFSVLVVFNITQLGNHFKLVYFQKIFYFSYPVKYLIQLWTIQLRYGTNIYLLTMVRGCNRFIAYFGYVSKIIWNESLINIHIIINLIIWYFAGYWCWKSFYVIMLSK